MADLGSDIATVFKDGNADVDPTGAEVSGRLCLAQALVRRLLTPRGRLIDDPDYGYDLTGEINDDIDASDLARIRAGVEGELAKDERVVSVIAELTYARKGGILTVNITVEDSAGPFQLVLAVTSVTVSVITIGQ